MKKFLTLTGILIVIVLAVFIYSKRYNGYSTYTVSAKEVVESVYASGYIDSSDSVVIRSEVSGYIEKIFVKENTPVKKGQVVAKISNPTLENNIKEVESQIEFTRERLRENSSFQKELKSYIESKRLKLENAKKVYDRRKELYQKGLISRENFEEVEKNFQIYKTEYEKEVENYMDTLNSLSSQLKSLIAKRDGVKSELDKYLIKSPIDGKILKKFVNVGDYINSMTSSNQLFFVGNDKDIETVLNVDEEYIPLLRVGQKVLVTLDSYPNSLFEGHIKTIESATDRSTRTVKVKADIRYDKKIVFGSVVEGNIIVDKKMGIFIPSDGYKDGYVEILEGNRIYKKRIEVDSRNYNGYLRVIRGLQEGQEIVIR